MRKMVQICPGDTELNLKLPELMVEQAILFILLCRANSAKAPVVDELKERFGLRRSTAAALLAHARREIKEMEERDAERLSLPFC